MGRENIPAKDSAAGRANGTSISDRAAEGPRDGRPVFWRASSWARYRNLIGSRRKRRGEGVTILMMMIMGCMYVL